MSVFYTGFLTVQDTVDRNGKGRIVEIGILVKRIAFLFSFIGSASVSAGITAFGTGTAACGTVKEKK